MLNAADVLVVKSYPLRRESETITLQQALAELTAYAGHGSVYQQRLNAGESIGGRDTQVCYAYTRADFWPGYKPRPDWLHGYWMVTEKAYRERIREARIA